MPISYYRKKDAGPPTSLVQSSTVHVTIGQHLTTKTFFIHKRLLCYYSDYFNAALNSDFSEGQSRHGFQEIALQEESPRLFDRVHNWLYSGNILTSTEMHNYNMQPLLIDLWLFADRRMMPALQNAALDAIDRNSNVTGKLCEISLIHHLYDSAPRTSKARSWVVEQFAGAKGIDKLFDRPVPQSWNFPSKEFLVALTVRSNELMRDGPVVHDRLEKLDMCVFHEHRDGQDCKVLALVDEKMRETLN